MRCKTDVIDIEGITSDNIKHYTEYREMKGGKGLQTIRAKPEALTARLGSEAPLTIGSYAFWTLKMPNLQYRKIDLDC